jgi:hypothetical protein
MDVFPIETLVSDLHPTRRGQELLENSQLRNGLPQQP